MSLKDTWTNKTDGVDDVVAEDINSVAQAVISVEDNMEGAEKVANKVTYLEIGSENTHTQYPSAKAVEEFVNYELSSYMNKFNDTDNTLNESSTDGKYPTSKAVVDYVGNIETALDGVIAEQNSIIAIQNTLIGGETV